LCVIVFNELLKHGPFSWKFLRDVIGLSGEHKVDACAIGLYQVQVEAAIWLHRCRLWLDVIRWVRSYWRDVAVNYLKIKVNIRVLRNPSVTDWSLDLGRSPDLVRGAMDCGFGSWIEILDRQLPALEHVVVADIVSLWQALGILSP